MRRQYLWLLPLLLFAGLLALMAGNIGSSPEAVIRSRMIGKPLPDFTLEGGAGRPGLTLADLHDGKPVLINIFASWCVPCAIEAPQLQVLRDKGARLYGIATRDTEEKIVAFTQRHGNPFERIGFDTNGNMMLVFGASGVPETYVVDGQGIVRFQHIGEIRPEHVKLLLHELEKAG